MSALGKLLAALLPAAVRYVVTRLGMKPGPDVAPVVPRKRSEPTELP